MFEPHFDFFPASVEGYFSKTTWTISTSLFSLNQLDDGSAWHPMLKIHFSLLSHSKRFHCYMASSARTEKSFLFHWVFRLFVLLFVIYVSLNYLSVLIQNFANYA